MLIWIALIIVYVLFLIKWRRKVFKITGAALLIALLIYAYQFYKKREEEKRDFAGVILSAEYIPGACPNDRPLKINIDNTTSKTVKLVGMQIDVYLRGYSDNVATPEKIRFPKIVSPHSKSFGCQKLPGIIISKLPTDLKNYNAADFDYKINKLSVYFYEKNETPPSSK